MINVGVTRAKENLIVVTDRKAIDILSKKDDDLYALIDYVEKNGTTQISHSIANKLTIGFSNNSKFEDEFYKTMLHYCTINGVRFERNIKIVDVFPEERHNTLVNKKEFDAAIFQGLEPKIIFEINGIEHYKNKRRMASDKIKMELLKGKQVLFLSIPNQYVKHYEFIIELIKKFKGDIYQKTLFDY